MNKLSLTKIIHRSPAASPPGSGGGEAIAATPAWLAPPPSGRRPSRPLCCMR